MARRVVRLSPHGLVQELMEDAESVPESSDGPVGILENRISELESLSQSVLFQNHVDASPENIIGRKAVTNYEKSCAYQIIADRCERLDEVYFAATLMAEIEKLRELTVDPEPEGCAPLSTHELRALSANSMARIMDAAAYLRLVASDEHPIAAGRRIIQSGRDAHSHRPAEWQRQVAAYRDALSCGARTKKEAKLIAAEKCACSIRSIERALRRVPSG